MVYLSSEIGVIVTGASLACFLTAAMWMAAEADRCGLANRMAGVLERASAGRGARLYAGVCVATAGLTALLSLDGAVVVMLPALRALERRGAAMRPLLLGTVAVANASSMALPQGNPSNLLVMSRMGLGAAGYTRAMLLPGMAATVIAAAAASRGAIRPMAPRSAGAARRPLDRAERRVLIGLAAAGLLDAVAPFAGISLWWPLCATAGATRLATRGGTAPVRVPWRLCAAVTAAAAALTGLVAALGLTHVQPPHGLWGQVATALVIGAVASLVNNLALGGVLGGVLAGPAGYAAAAGLAAGSLATWRGSVATMLALNGAGPAGAAARRGYTRRWAPIAAAATVAAAGLLSLTAG
ncbi:MAG: SLC13 family permease [Gaiellales bacterium]